MNDELLTRGIDQVVGQPELEAALKSGKKLRLKFGVDPTRPDIHLGHAVILRKLRQFQDLGHTVIFLIGDYTTRIGDPSGRNQTRPMLSDAEIADNVKTYLDQVGKILDIDRAEIRYNGEWHAKLSFVDLIKLASQISVAQLIERDDFHQRLGSGQELALHELLYPLMQAYDSVMLEADVEFGGTDQLFNMLAGRALQKKLGQPPQQVVIGKLLVGTEGSKKMSKSYDNYIGLTDVPVDMYGKVMRVPDDLIAPYYELCTDIETAAIEELVKTLAEGANPRDAKASLAREIVAIYHGQDTALAAEAAWNKQFRDKEQPDEMPIARIASDQSQLLLSVRLSNVFEFSKTEAKRLIEQGGVKINGKVVEEDASLEVKDGDVLQVGPRRFSLIKIVK